MSTKKAKAKKASSKKAATSIIVTGNGKRFEAPSRTAARRYVKGQYNAAVRDGKVKGKRASCMMNVPEAFRSKFKINGVTAGAA